MSNEIDIAFALLRSSLEGRDISKSRSLEVSLSAQSWWHLFRLLQTNHVAALTADTMALLDVPREVKIPWLAEQEKATSWYRYQQQIQQDIVNLLQKHGIETLVLKGTRTAQHYPQPELREFGDLDLYFYDRHDEADRIVQRHFGVDITNDINHHTKYNLRGVTVESHYHLLNHYHPRSNRTFEALLQQLLGAFPNSSPKLGEVPVRAEECVSTFEVLFLLRHIACHFAASRITLRDLVDWALTCRALDNQVDWSLVEKTISDYGMTDFVSALNTIAHSRLGVQLGSQKVEESKSQKNTLSPFHSSTLPLIEKDLVYGSPQSADHEREDLGRLFWKVRRHRANRWKQQLVFNDSSLSLLLSSLTAHTRNPRSILHKL